MMVTQLLPEGECRITEFPEGIITPTNIYFWTASDGWKKWINSDSVEGGGYWRSFTDEDLLRTLEVLKQQAIGAIVQQQTKQQDTSE
jgi:hypothetical protein